MEDTENDDRETFLDAGWALFEGVMQTLGPDRAQIAAAWWNECRAHLSTMASSESERSRAMMDDVAYGLEHGLSHEKSFAIVMANYTTDHTETIQKLAEMAIPALVEAFSTPSPCASIDPSDAAAYMWRNAGEGDAGNIVDADATGSPLHEQPPIDEEGPTAR